MNNENIEIWACCYSEKEDVSVSCGFYINSISSFDKLKTKEMIYEELSESFWENHFEFEAGIEKAEKLLLSNADLTPYDAFFEVFGHFSVSYEKDGEMIYFDLDMPMRTWSISKCRNSSRTN